MIGQTLTHFRITAKLGEGGMGEVYRAEDTKLGREVAIKVLPEAFTEDPERFARFEREAHVLASLNHPNIAGIHQVEEVEGTHFLVMELVEGDDLAERLSKGAIPVEEALGLAVQIAKGLEAAHGRGVVHRDLKPANVKITPDGQIKILDFGLAKTGADTGPDVDLSRSPTLTAQMTQAGTILGTAAYMSPEQARGQEVDGQTDVWALGVVLFEMLTGERTFAGETTTDTIAAIIERQPEWEALPTATPPLVRSLLRRCLQKDRDRRLHDVADARLELEEALSEPPAEQAEVAAAAPTARSARHILGWTLAGGLLGLTIGVALPTWIGRSESLPTTPFSNAHLSIELADETTLFMTDNPAMAISSDRRRLVWAAVYPDGLVRLQVRGIDDAVARQLEGTENARGPLFSPDGRWIAYFDGVESQLEKIPFEGGIPTKICDTPPGSKGATWGTRGDIVFSYGYDGGLARVPADGGEPEVLTEPDHDDGVTTHRFPHFLPNGRTVLFMVADHHIETYDDARIEALDLNTGERKLLLEGGMNPRYVETGHLIYARHGGLRAVPFDPQTLAIEGQPKEVFTGVVTNGGFGFGQYALTPGGTLVYSAGGPEIYARRFVRADRSGEPEPLPIPERVYEEPFDLSPDGRRLAITDTLANFSIRIWEFERDILSRLVTGGNNQGPVWMPDSERLIFRSDRRGSGANELMWIQADGSNQPQPLYESRRLVWPGSVSPDGQLVTYEEDDPETDFDIWVLPLGDGMKPGTPRRVVATEGSDRRPDFSPDGRWLAYESNETGRYEIYVQSFPGPGPRAQVSARGGREPRWSPAGDAIYYVHQASAQIMRAPVQTDPELLIGPAGPFLPFDSPRRWYSIEPDGEHFIYLQVGSQAKPITRLRIVFNWADELNRIFAGPSG